jgi:hypothetical protein
LTYVGRVFEDSATKTYARVARDRVVWRRVREKAVWAIARVCWLVWISIRERVILGEGTYFRLDLEP